MNNIQIADGTVMIDGVVYLPLAQEINAESVGELLKKARKNKGLSTSQLAKLTQCSKQHINLIERGNANMSLRVAKRIANALQLDIRQIAILTN